jgi:hypothetical protein
MFMKYDKIFLLQVIREITDSMDKRTKHTEEGIEKVRREKTSFLNKLFCGDLEILTNKIQLLLHLFSYHNRIQY